MTRLFVSVTNKTPGNVVMMIFVVIPESNVFKVPSTAPCITLTPAFSVIACAVIVKIHSV